MTKFPVYATTKTYKGKRHIYFGGRKFKTDIFVGYFIEDEFDGLPSKTFLPNSRYYSSSIDLRQAWSVLS